MRVELARAVVERHVSTAQMAARLGVPYTTATESVKRYRAGGEAALRPAERTRIGKPPTAKSARDAAILATCAAQPQAGSRRIRDVMGPLSIASPDVVYES